MNVANLISNSSSGLLRKEGECVLESLAQAQFRKHAQAYRNIGYELTVCTNTNAVNGRKVAQDTRRSPPVGVGVEMQESLQ
jgi:hypothetical protein